MSRRRRQRGSVRTLPSGSKQVCLYAGIDPLTGRPHYLRETIPAGPNQDREVGRVLTRFANQVDEQRAPKTNAKFSVLIDAWSEVLDVEPLTRKTYLGYIDKHIRPILANLQAGRIGPDDLDRLYAKLRTCRDHCWRLGKSSGHVCRPLAASTIRQIHWIISGIFTRGLRWGWISTNPADLADQGKLPTPNPDPPSADEIAALIRQAYRHDPEWAVFLWVKATTGARRGEMCALRLGDLDDGQVLSVERSAYRLDGELRVKTTKTHQQRRLVLDDVTFALLRGVVEVRRRRARALGIDLPLDAYMWSPAPDGGVPASPDAVSARFTRLAAGVGVKTSLKNLRHYSATELVMAGVDPRTVAGRLGHGGGGTTTLRVYTAWWSEADQRAAKALGNRHQAPPELTAAYRPALDARQHADGEAADLPQVVEPSTPPYQRIATDLRGAIGCGALAPGDHLPTVKELTERYQVSAGTAHRALTILKEEHLIEGSRGRRMVVVNA